MRLLWAYGWGDDEASRTIAAWEPYWDNTVEAATLDDPALEAECPPTSTGHEPAPVTGIPGYPATTGVCVTRASYDPVGNLTRVDNPTAIVTGNEGRYQSFTYTDDNLLTVVEGPNPAVDSGDIDTRIDTARIGYDASGRVIFSSTPTGIVTPTSGGEQRWVTKTGYTADGLAAISEQRALTDTTAQRRVERTYDHAGNVTTIDTMISATRTDTSTTSWYSDGTEREETTVVTGHNASTITWRWGYNPAGQTTHTWSPSAVAHAANNTAGEPTVMTYSPDGLVTLMAEPVAVDGTQHRHTSYEHDGLGRVVTEGTALVGTGATVAPPKQFTWTTMGLPATEVGRTGVVQGFGYNADGQLAGAAEDNHDSVVLADYYLNGRLHATAVQQTGVAADRFQKFTYHGDGLEASRTFGTDDTFATSDNVQAYAYNDARSLTDVVSIGWGSAWSQWTIGADRAVRQITLTDPPNGTAPARTTTIDRNPDGTVAEQILHAGGPGTTTIDQWNYTYDATGRIASKQRSGQAGTLNDVYGYDEAGRLSTVNGTQIPFDPNGNRLRSADNKGLTFRADNSIRTGPAGLP